MTDSLLDLNRETKGDLKILKKGQIYVKETG
jgi:hypothetical protein